MNPAKLSSISAVKPVPVTVTVVPPSVDPVVGSIALMVTGPCALKALASVTVAPPGLVTVRSCTPGGAAMVNTIVAWVPPEATNAEAALAAPSMNCAFGMKPLPMTVKFVDVPTMPPVRLRLVSVGSGIPV